MKIKFSFVCIAIVYVLGIISCSKEPVIQPESHIIKESIEEDDLDFAGRIFWLGAENEDKDVIMKLSLFASDIESASIVVLDGESLEANKDIIDDAYNKSKIIILCDPDFSVYNRIAETLGWPIGSCDDEKSELFAFSLAGTSSLLTPEDLIVIDEPELLPDSDSDIAIPIVEPNEDGIIEKYEVPDFEELISLKNIIEPFVKMVNMMFVDLDCITKAGNGDIQNLSNYISDSKSISFPIKLLFAETTGSDKDYLVGTYSNIVRFRYQPLYAHSGQSTTGDYYIMNLSYDSIPGDSFKGNDLVRSHGAVDVHYTGAFLRTLGIKTYIQAPQGQSNNGGPYFIEGFSPIPETLNDCKNYSKTKGWNIGGGITVGGELGVEKKAKGDVQFTWGYSNSSTVSFSLSDLKIENHSYRDGKNGDVAQWKLICQNLPKKDGKRHITSCPSIAMSTSTCHTNWIWHINKYGDGSKGTIGEMVIEFNPVLGIARNGFWFKYADYSYDLVSRSLLSLFSRPVNNKVKIPMVAPNRTPFGTIRIINTIPDVVISNIQVKNYSNGNLVYESNGDLLEQKSREISIATGKYSISFIGTNRRTGIKENYVLGSEYLEVKNRRLSDDDVTVIDAGTRFVKK